MCLDFIQGACTESLARGYSIYPWVWRCGPATCTLTLFKAKIADFPTLFNTEFRFLIPCLRHLTRNQKQNCCSLVRKTYAQTVYRPNDKINTLSKTKIPKNIRWLAARPH